MWKELKEAKRQQKKKVGNSVKYFFVKNKFLRIIVSWMHLKKRGNQRSVFLKEKKNQPKKREEKINKGSNFNFIYLDF